MNALAHLVAQTLNHPRRLARTDPLSITYTVQRTYTPAGRTREMLACLSHPDFAGAKAAQWWQRRAPDGVVPTGTDQAIAWIADGLELKRPAAIVVNETGRWPEIVKFEWSNDESNRTDADAHGAAIED